MSAFDRAHADELAPASLSVTQFNVLSVLLRAHQALTMGKLAQAVAVRAANLTAVADSLAARGLVDRELNPDDRRSFLVSITAEGQRFMADFLPGHWRVLQDLMSGLSRPERTKLLSLLEKLLTSLRESEQAQQAARANGRRGNGAAAGRAAPAAGADARVSADRIDLHTHGLPPDLPALGRRYAGAWPELVATGACTADLMVGERHFRAIDDRCWQPQRRIADMDRDGVTLQVVSPIPVTFSYWLPADGAADLARAQNEWFAGLVRDDPAHFAGLATVPLQAPDQAARMAAQAMEELGLAGVEIGTNVDGGPLDAPELESFWAACAESGALIFIHPWQVLGAERLRAHNLAYAVGNPAETAAAAATLVLGGVLDRHPSLRIVLAHGGGAFIALLPRLDQVAANLPAAGGAVRPSDYVRRFYYDSLVYDSGSAARLPADELAAVLTGTARLLLAPPRGQTPAGQ